jgi:hypothetical protein
MLRGLIANALGPQEGRALGPERNRCTQARSCNPRSALTLFRMYQEEVLVVHEIASAFIGAFSRGLLLSAFSLR